MVLKRERFNLERIATKNTNHQFYFRVKLTFKKVESMTGTRLADIERMHKLVGIFSGAATKKIKVWDDVGIFENLFTKDQSSVELIQELRKKDSL